MNLFSFLFRRKARTARPPQNARLGLESLEDRLVLDATTPVVYGTEQYVLGQIALDEYKADNNQLTRTDVINLLDVVDGTEQYQLANGKVTFTPVSNPNPDANVSSAGLKFLRNLDAHSTDWGMDPDVANLLGKVVDSNPANMTYQDADDISQELLPSGKLTGKSPEWKMQTLVNKWFDGDNLPTIDIPDATYENAEGNLFGPTDVPKPSDVHQGSVGDCYFLAALAETAQQDPQAIKNMFIDDGDGIYTVRFYQYNLTTQQWQADYVTVNSELPVNQKGDFVYANRGQSASDPSNVLWVALAEKAYAQLAEEGWSRAPNLEGSTAGADKGGTVDAYSILAGGNPKVAMQQITGSADASKLTFPSTDPTLAESNFETMVTDFQKGDLVTIGTPKDLSGSTLHKNHAYYVVAIDEANQTVTLGDPNKPGQEITVSLANLETDANGASVVVPG